MDRAWFFLAGVPPCGLSVQIGVILLSSELCLGRPYLSLAVWPCLYCTRMATPPAAKLVVETEWSCRPVSVGMVSHLEVSYWACHAMHKVVALTSSSRPPLACWRISAVWSVCIEQWL